MTRKLLVVLVLIAVLFQAVSGVAAAGGSGSVDRQDSPVVKSDEQDDGDTGSGDEQDESEDDESDDESEDEESESEDDESEDEDEESEDEDEESEDEEPAEDEAADGPGEATGEPGKPEEEGESVVSDIPSSTEEESGDSGSITVVYHASSVEVTVVEFFRPEHAAEPWNFEGERLGESRTENGAVVATFALGQVFTVFEYNEITGAYDYRGYGRVLGLHDGAIDIWSDGDTASVLFDALEWTPKGAR